MNTSDSTTSSDLAFVSGETEGEPRYTLAEAQHELNKAACASRGHDYEVLETLGEDNPHSILCNRCGRSWSVQPTS